MGQSASVAADSAQSASVAAGASGPQVGGAARTYFTHDNGGRPFQVNVKGGGVEILKDSNKDLDKDPGPYLPLMTFKATKVLVGKKSPGGGYDGLSPKEAEGNSILLKLGPSRWAFVGHEIYEFTPIDGDTIVAFYSDIGNSDVPYPYAVGKTHTYFFLDRAAVENSFFKAGEGAYDQYYYEHRQSMRLRGYVRGAVAKFKKGEREEIQARIAEFKAKRRTVKSKTLHKRLV